MIDGLKPYSKYKDSGVPWLGEVPEHWEVRRLKHWVDVNKHVLAESTPPDYEFSYLEIGSVGTGKLLNKCQRLRFSSAPSRARRIVRAGDTIVSTVRTYLKAVYFINEDEENLVVSTGFAVLTPRERTAPKFVSYLVQSDSFTNRVTAESVGIAYPAIAETRLGSFHVAIPPLPEQTAIVRFLDWAERRVRWVIRAREKRIKLLEEYKQALIHQAVTGRIDVRTGKLYPKYKNSGVEWLGEVPEHWEVVSLRRKLRMYGGIKIGPFGSQLKIDQMTHAGYKVYGQANVIVRDFALGHKFISPKKFDELRAYELRPNDVVVTMMGTSGRCCVVPESASPGIMDSHLLRLRLTEGASRRFLADLVNNAPYVQEQISVAGKGSIMHGLNSSIIKSLVIALPPLPEQTAIVEFLDERTEKIDAAISADRRVIDLLKEFRTRLIADVVTGKLDVREAAASLPDEPDGLEPDNEIDVLRSDEDIDTFDNETSESV